MIGYDARHGAIAQLGEHLHGMQKVRGSSPRLGKIFLSFCSALICAWHLCLVLHGVRRDGCAVGARWNELDPDATEPEESRFVLSPTADPDSLADALGRALGVRGVVRKKRSLYMVGRTRIHVDEVEGLGDFLELEVVLADEESKEAGLAVARELREKGFMKIISLAQTVPGILIKRRM